MQTISARAAPAEPRAPELEAEVDEQVVGRATAAVVSVALLILLLSGPTDGQRIYPLLLLFVFSFIGVEVLRRQARREFVTQPSLSP